MNKKEIGKRIKAIRMRLGENQTQFGERFSPPIGKGGVSRWESGDTKPNAKRLEKIAELGGVSVEYLINGSRLSIDDIKKLADKLTKEKHLTSEQIKKANEAMLDSKEISKTIFDSINQKAEAKLKNQQQTLKEYPLNPFDRDLYADFVSLFNLLRLTGSEEQYVSFSTLINFILRIANGTIEYDKDDIIPNIDKFLSSFPVKKDNSDESK